MPQTSLDTLGITPRDPGRCPHSPGLLRSGDGPSERVLRLSCKRWDCDSCARRKRKRLYGRFCHVNFQRFITLTQTHRDGESISDALARFQRDFGDLIQRIRRKYGKDSIEYFRVWELTKKGQPHMHLLTVGKYIPQRWLSRAWKEISGASIVDIRRVQKGRSNFGYLMKYLSKEENMPRKTHRYQASYRVVERHGTVTRETTEVGREWQYLPVDYDNYIKDMERQGWMVWRDIGNGDVTLLIEDVTENGIMTDESYSFIATATARAADLYDYLLHPQRLTTL